MSRRGGFKSASFQCPDSGVGVTVTNRGGWQVLLDDDYTEERPEEFADVIKDTQDWCSRANRALAGLRSFDEVERALVRLGCEADDLDPLTW